MSFSCVHSPRRRSWLQPVVLLPRQHIRLGSKGESMHPSSNRRCGVRIAPLRLLVSDTPQVGGGLLKFQFPLVALLYPDGAQVLVTRATITHYFVVSHHGRAIVQEQDLEIIESQLLDVCHAHAF